MNTTRSAIWISVAALVIAVLSYVNATRPPSNTKAKAKVMFITGGDTPFWKLTAAGAKSAARQYEVDLSLALPKGGHQEQSEILGRITPDKYDGVAISPRAASKQNKILGKIAKKVHLITFDSDAPESDRLCYIGTDNYSAGRLAAQLVKNALPDGGKIAVLVATFSKDNAILRVKGFQEEMQRVPLYEEDGELAEYKILEPLEDGIIKDRCRENINSIMQEHPDVAAFVGMFSYHGPVLLHEFIEADSKKKPVFIVFDEEDEVLAGIENGQIYATVVQDPFKYGFESVRMLAELQRGNRMELPVAGSGSLYIPCEAITPDNVRAFKEQLALRERSMEPRKSSE